MKVPFIGDAEDHITEAAVSASATNVVPIGSVLAVTRSGILRRTFPVAVTTSAVAINQDLKALKPIGGIEPKYVAWYLRSDEQSILHDCSKDGTTVDSIDFPVLLKREIPIAPVVEQGRIVAAIEEQFSRLDAGVAALERVHHNLKRLRIALMQAAVLGRLQIIVEDNYAIQQQTPGVVTSIKRRAGRLWGSGSVPQLTEEERTSIPGHWQWSKVSELGSNTEETVQVGPMSMRSADFVELGIPVLNVGSVQWDWIDESKLNYLPPAVAESFSRYRIRPGDVLFTRSGTVGRAAIAEERHRDWLMTFHLLRVRVDPSVCLPEYLRMVFEAAPHVRRQARGAAIGTTRAGFNTRLLAELDVPLPPFPEQIAIVRTVQHYMSQMGGIDPSTWMSKCHALRSSILTAAFSGKLVTQDSNDEPASALLERIASGRVPSNGQRSARTHRARGLPEEVRA
jgi:type I restriction enzyme S subunit